MFAFENEEGVAAWALVVDFVSFRFGMSMLWSEDNSVAVFFASLVIVLGMIAVEACSEVAEFASEYTTMDVTFVLLEAVVDAGRTAGLASLAGVVADLRIVSVLTMSMLPDEMENEVSPEHGLLPREPPELSPVDFGIAK